MKYIAILAFFGMASCAAAPTELPVDFNPEFTF